MSNHVDLNSKNKMARTPPMIGMLINHGNDSANKAMGMADTVATIMATVQIRRVGNGATLLVFILIVGLLEL